MYYTKTPTEKEEVSIDGVHHQQKHAFVSYIFQSNSILEDLLFYFTYYTQKLAQIKLSFFFFNKCKKTRTVILIFPFKISDGKYSNIRC
jgi:hypothetical protein